MKIKKIHISRGDFWTHSADWASCCAFLKRCQILVYDELKNVSIMVTCNA